MRRVIAAIASLIVFAGFAVAVTDDKANAQTFDLRADAYEGDSVHLRGDHRAATLVITLKLGQSLDITLPPAIGREPFSYFMRGLPGSLGLVFDENTRRLSGTPKGRITTDDLYYWDYVAVDATSWDVVLPMVLDFPPVTLSIPEGDTIINSRQGQPITSIVLPPASYGKDPINYSVANLPSGLVFNANTRRLSGTPTYEPGSYESEYYAEDVSGVSGRNSSVHMNLWINPPAAPGLKLAETRPELGTLDQNVARRGAWSAYDDEEWYTFRLDKPTELTVELGSNDADATLVVAGYTNKDSGPGTDAKLVIDLNPGRYSIKAQREDFNAGLNYYTLSVSSPDFAPVVTSTTPTAEGAWPVITSDTPIIQIVPLAGRIVARRLDDGRIEFAWDIEDGDRVLPSARYLPANPPTGRWLNSSEIIAHDVSIGRINVRVRAEDGRIEFAFTPTDGERILPPSRYFPASAPVNRWLRSTLIEWGI